MYYKLFIFGEQKLFALVRIPFLEFSLHLKPSFIFEGKRYQILNYLLPANKIEFDENGNEKYTSFKNDEISLKTACLPELYVAEIPSF